MINKLFYAILIFSLSIYAGLFSNSISYDSPDFYLMGGEQTTIKSKQWIEEIKDKFGTSENSIDQLTKVRRWIKDTFLYESNRGATIGVFTAEELYAARTWHGCHDLAHLFAATIRQLGYPCVMVETTSVFWSKRYVKDPDLDEDVQGHCFTEVYLNGKWILFDPMSPLILKDYNYHDPFIPSFDFYGDEPDGFYVIAKGKDSWDCGIKNLNDLIHLQKTLSISLFESCP